MKNATPKELEEIREFMNSLDRKEMTKYEFRFDPKIAQHDTGHLGCDDVYGAEGEKLCGWLSLGTIDEKRVTLSKNMHYLPVKLVGMEYCLLSFVEKLSRMIKRNRIKLGL